MPWCGTGDEAPVDPDAVYTERTTPFKPMWTAEAGKQMEEMHGILPIRL